MFDRQDARLAAKAALLFAMGSSLLLGVAAVIGVAWRVLIFAAG